MLDASILTRQAWWLHFWPSHAFLHALVKSQSGRWCFRCKQRQMPCAVVGMFHCSTCWSGSFPKGLNAHFSYGLLLLNMAQSPGDLPANSPREKLKNFVFIKKNPYDTNNEGNKHVQASWGSLSKSTHKNTHTDITLKRDLIWSKTSLLLLQSQAKMLIMMWVKG